MPFAPVFSAPPYSDISYNPSVSVTGSKMVFTHVQDVVASNADGTSPVVIWTQADHGGAIQGIPRISYDGTKVVFFIQSLGLIRDFWTMNIDGSNLQQITSFAYAWSSTARASWSPDGTQIVFSVQDATLTRQELWTMNADGSDQTMIYSTGTGVSANYPYWGANDKVIFTEDSSPPLLRTINPDGTGVATITLDLVSPDPTTFTRMDTPAYSPDASKLALEVRIGTDSYLLEADADGSNTEVIVSPSDSPGLFMSQTFYSGVSFTAGGINIYWPAATGESPSIYQLVQPPRLPICRVLYGLG